MVSGMCFLIIDYSNRDVSMEGVDIGGKADVGWGVKWATALEE